MDFFKNQETAKRKTWLLVLGFGCGVAATLFALDLALLHFVPELDSQMRQYILIGVGVIFVLACIYKFFQLYRGGAAIIKMTGATLIDRDTNNHQLRVLINVADEMSIASGVICPQLYILENENGINAFVAGFKPNDSVMVVTQGLLDNLNRQELQGVIAHEFSHILNADTRLNLRIMIILHGLFAVFNIGHILLRSGSRTRCRSSRGAGQVMILGLIFFAVGLIAYLFGLLVRAAISRERESLADHCAVQFTRDNTGLVGALLKIKAQGDAALMDNNKAEELNHMCFSITQKMIDFNFLGTHPPISQRVQALDPDGSIKASFINKLRDSTEPNSNNRDIINNDGSKCSKEVDKPDSKINSQEPQNAINSAFGQDNAAPVIAAAMLATIANCSEENLEHAQTKLTAIPDLVKQQTETKSGAQLLLYALLLCHSTEQVKTHNLSLSNEHRSILTELQSFEFLQDPSNRLLLVMQCMPTLLTLAKDKREEFIANCYELANSDQSFSLFEAVLIAVLNTKLAGKSSTKKPSIQSIACILQQLSSSADNLSKALQNLKLKADLSINCDAREIRAHLNKLPAMSNKSKQRFLQAAAIALGDNTDPEAISLFRGICVLLDCPLPL